MTTKRTLRNVRTPAPGKTSGAPHAREARELRTETMATKRQTKKADEAANEAAETEETQAVATTGNADGAMPAFLAETRNASNDTLDGLGDFQSTPRIGFVQPQSGPDRKAEFGEGAVLILPDGELVCNVDGSVCVVPIYFFPTWEVWSDIDDEQSDMILESSDDEKSDIAVRCKNPKTRTQKYQLGDEEYEATYVESLNYVVRIEDGPSAGAYAVLTFNRGAHYIGRKIAGVLKRRGIAIYGNRVKLKPVHKTKGRYNWYEFAVSNPTAEEGGAYVPDQVDFEVLEAQHNAFKSLHAAGGLGVNRDDETHDASAGEGDADSEEVGGQF